MTAINQASTVLSPLDSIATDALKKWTVEDYHRMSEYGILDSAERTELIAGYVTLMSAKRTPHITALRLLATQFDNYLLNRPFFASTQDPIYIDSHSEPEPDLAIIRGSVLDYAEQHPRPEDVVLLVEVADSTLKQDRDIKDKIYASVGIAEYWVQDLKNNCLHVFRNPTPSGYSSKTVLSTSDKVSPLAFPDLSLSLEALFPPYYA